MQRLHYLALALAATVATGGRALAGSEHAHAVNAETTSPAPSCREFLDEPRDAISVAFRWDQRLSFAGCSQSFAVAPFRGAPAQLPKLVAGVEGAFAASIDIYRDAMGTGPADVRIRGAFALGMAYLAIADRARAAIDPEDALARSALEPLLDADLRRAIAAFDEVDFLAEDYPQAGRANPMAAYAIRNARIAARLLRR